MASALLPSSFRLLALAQHWEKFGFFLPRPLLDWAEIHACPAAISDVSVDQDIDFWRSRKIALVKQTAYHALYPQPERILAGNRSFKRLPPWTILIFG